MHGHEIGRRELSMGAEVSGCKLYQRVSMPPSRLVGGYHPPPAFYLLVWGEAVQPRLRVYDVFLKMILEHGSFALNRPPRRSSTQRK